VIGQRELAPFRHAFTHFELTVRPLLVDVQAQPRAAEPQGQWLDLEQAARLGLPAPVRSLLLQQVPPADAPPPAVLHK
jgi:hypothetical protein